MRMPRGLGWLSGALPGYTSMSLTIQSASVPDVDAKIDAMIGPAITTSSVERRRLIDEHVGPRGGEALILDHPQMSLRRPRLGAPGHGLRGIGDVLVESEVATYAGRRGVNDSPPSGLEVQRRDSVRARGGQVSNVLHALPPVSKTVASAAARRPCPSGDA